MANFLLCLALFRLVLPIFMSVCILFRPSGLSAIYLLLLFYFPFVPTPTQRTMAGQTGIYLKILIVVSALASVAQLAFQIVLFSFPPYGRFLNEHCGFWEKVLRHVGFVRLDGISARSAVTWLSPELLMLLISIVFLITMKKITVGRAVGVLEDGSIATAPSTLPSKKKPKQKYFSILTAVGRYATLAALCLAAVLRPSILGGLYFVIFLSAATWWACYKQLRKGFAIMLCCLMPIVALHICAVYAYQFQWIQELLDKNSPYARYFALTPILTVNCKGDPRDFIWAIDEWATYVNPIALYLLYYVVALETHGLLKPEIFKKEKAATGEKTPLIRGGVSPAKRYGSGKKGPGVYQDSTGSVTVTGENPEEIQLDQLGTTEEEYSPSVFENILFALESILQVIIKSSYIATNIIMMAWSITYLSWITFVLLIWANLIWLVPNQRKSMLRSSPFLVFYAWFLLISAYIYSMNLTEDELPSSVQGVNLAQIGFVKVTVLPCNPLLVKCVFTIMFWVALRQYMQEKMEQRQSSALADMVAPLQVNVGIATGVNKDQEKGNRIMEKFGRVINKFLTKFWIWVVAITLFAVAITGQRMTVFRIIYMALFLFFVLSFQLSFRGWRRLMFGFWLTVIIYSMVILVLVYTYQFDNFPDYWSDYLHIPVEQQLDIGLERFETKRLFVRLVTPTFFVIITVIQLHYFHKDFMELSDPKNTSATTYDEHDQSSLQGGAAVARDADKDDLTATTTSIKFDLSELGNMSSVQFQHLAESWLARLHHAMNLTYTFLELHMPKIVLLFAMLLCVYDKCSMYFIVIELIILSLIFGRPMRNFAICCSSVLVSMLLLARMIYQIQYINPANWNVTCHVSESNGTAHVIENNAEWFGFVKSDDETNTLPTLLRWNIIYILVVTLWAVVLVRQFNYRVSRGKPTTRAFFMFPRITRVDADKSLTNCVKYLANYAFFKFGVEISLMATVALIGFRMDMYAVIYGVWLCVLYSMSRNMLSKIWNVYMMFIAIFLPLQYVMVVGLPPTLCIDYPWDESELLRRLQEWAYLLDPDYPPNPKKLICDFVLLLLVSRQSVVFRIEKRYAGQNYAGGSNDSIIHHAENKNFENPVPDFITYVRSYLDVFKRAILMAFLWVTLAIVFLAGTNRVNLFSIGYLIGAFVFLWQGSDIYLRPIPKILKAWNWLLGYNVAVILLKAVLQLLGCVFIQEIASSCWSIQLFGVGCVKKFGNVVKADGYDDPDECKVPREFIGMVWDGLCFGFLIMQRRIFQSYNFFHMIDETKATTILASRGAELIEELRLKRMNDQDELERKVLEKIKAKMDRIKATQQKIQGASYRDDMSHYAEQQPPLAHSTSLSSCTSGTSQQTAGYHTPIDDDEPAPLTPRSSLMQPQAPSPYSAIMTVSLEGYLEPQRISFSSPPNSELNPQHRPPSPDDSFPVFSPPPYDEAPPYAEAVVGAGAEETRLHRRNTLGPPWMHDRLVTPRQSVISYSSRSPLSHHEYTVLKNRPNVRRRSPKSYKEAIRSGDYYMFDDMDDEEELDLLPVEPEEDEDDQGRRLTIGELLSTAMKTSIRVSKNEFKRRLSMPLPKRKPPQSQISTALSAPPTVDEAQKSVTIAEKSEEEPQPGTSKDEDISELSEPREYTLGEKVINFILFAWAFVQSAMVSMTRFLNKYSKDYRYVLRVLSKEKKLLKEHTTYNEGLRIGSGQVWQPASSYHSLIRQNLVATEVQTSESGEKPPISEDSDTKALATPLPYTTEPERRKASVLTVPKIRILAPSLERGLDSPGSSRGPASSKVSVLEDYEEGEMSSYDQPTIVRLLLAAWFVIMSRSELLCYFIIFLVQVKSATFLSLPLPLMVFLWGTLTIPRPSKTFWVTIIAYTEIMVLIKCMFQFDIIPWNRNQLIINDPFYPPRIIGIERKKNYALWDLLLLLVVFFHRFMLKSMGIWRTTVPVPAALLSEGDYKFEDGQLVPISSSSPKIQSDMEQLVDNEEEKKEEEDAMHSDSTEDRIVSLHTESVEPSEHFPHVIQLASSKYAESFRLFFQHLLDPTSRVAADVYSYMFLCDFFNFFVILVGYSSFGTQLGDEGVSSYLEDNRVPALFLVMLILQFMLIVIDRGIFLRKNILGKIIFQFTQIFLLHLWLFVLFPIMTGSQFNTVLPPQIFYMVKCFYLLLSAYQIRCGYPTRILGNFLCKGYNFVNMVLFKAFMAVPFLFELRTVMDWMWTDTSMTVFDWIKMEDIFAHIFQLKCSRQAEDEYPQPRGERKKPIAKYVMGGIILAVIIGIIWFPLVFFSLGNAVGEPNPPYEITLEIRIGPYEPVYKMSAQNNSIYSFNDDDMQRLTNAYSHRKSAAAFIQNYEPADIAAIKLSTDSANIWSISPSDRQRMVEEVQSSKPLNVRFEYKVSHKTSKPEDSGVIPDNIEIKIPASMPDRPNPVRNNLLLMLEGQPSQPLNLEYILPKFLKVTNRGTAKAISSLMDPEPVEMARTYRSIRMDLLRPNGTVSPNTISDREWWRVHENCSDKNYGMFLKSLPYADCNNIILYTFNDKIFPSTLNIITGGGIIGLYTTLVFVASRVLRGFFAEQCFKIMFEDMPNVDRVLQLCLDVYLVREAREYALEEDLFAKLVFLFRSPETLIKWTRPKEEIGDDEDPEGDD